MRANVSFRVKSIPVAQPRQRHRVVTTGGKAFAQNYTPTKAPVNVFKAAVQDAASMHFTGPMTGPIALSLTFVMPRPKSMFWKSRPMPRAWCAKKPDAENLAKGVLDALTSIAYVDDAQVVNLEITKYIAAGHESPHVQIWIEEAIPA